MMVFGHCNSGWVGRNLDSPIQSLTYSSPRDDETALVHKWGVSLQIFFCKLSHSVFWGAGEMAGHERSWETECTQLQKKKKKKRFGRESRLPHQITLYEPEAVSSSLESV